MITVTLTSQYNTWIMTAAPEQAWPFATEAASRDGFAKVTVSGDLEA